MKEINLIVRQIFEKTICLSRAIGWMGVIVVLVLVTLGCEQEESVLETSPKTVVIEKNGIKLILEMRIDGTISSVRFASPGMSGIESIAASAEEFFKEYLKTTPADEFEKVPHSSKRPEFIHEHYDQYYKGIRVEGAGYNFHYKNGKMYFANGHYLRIGDLNTTPDISGERAADLFAQYKMIPARSIIDFTSELIVKEIPVDRRKAAAVIPKVVYRIYLYADHENNREIGFVDAHTGIVLITEPRWIN